MVEFLLNLVLTGLCVFSIGYGPLLMAQCLRWRTCSIHLYNSVAVNHPGPPNNFSSIPHLLDFLQLAAECMKLTAPCKETWGQVTGGAELTLPIGIFLPCKGQRR